MTGDSFEVLGKWKVAVTTVTCISRGRSLTVLSGDVYNMKTRKIEKLGNGVTPARRGEEGR